MVLQKAIGRDGKPESFKARKGLGYGQDPVAMDSIARHWIFDPDTVDGRPFDARIAMESPFGSDALRQHALRFQTDSKTNLLRVDPHYP